MTITLSLINLAQATPRYGVQRLEPRIARGWQVDLWVWRWYWTFDRRA